MPFCFFRQPPFARPRTAAAACRRLPSCTRDRPRTAVKAPHTSRRSGDVRFVPLSSDSAYIGRKRRPSVGHESVESPFSGYALEVVYVLAGEVESGSGDEVLDGLGDEDLRWLCEGADSGSDVDCHAADLVVDDLAFAGVQADSDLDAEARDRRDQRSGAMQCADGSVEGGEEAISRGVDFLSAIPGEQAAYGGVMLLDRVPPATVPH